MLATDIHFESNGTRIRSVIEVFPLQIEIQIEIEIAKLIS